MPGDVTFTDEFGVVHSGDPTTIISACGRILLDIRDNTVRSRPADDPAKHITCLFCLVGGDTTWNQLQQTLKLIEQYGVTVNHGALDRLEATL